MVLSSFGDGLHVAIAGASGGIAQAVLRRLADSGQVSTFSLLSRNPLDEMPERARWIACDFQRPDTIAQVSGELANAPAIDLVFVATGLLHDGDLQPEKDWRHLSPDAMARAFQVNTIGPALLAQGLLPLMPREGRSVFAALSARVGSISDNQIGGWYSYRASKAALNMVLRCLAIELVRKRRQTICVGLHPGTVDTRLSEPFQANTRPAQVVPPDQSAENLLAVIDGLEPSDSGKLIGWNGETIPF